MSRSTIYRVFRSRVMAFREFRNSWGTAPPLWDELGHRYLGWVKSSSAVGMRAATLRPLWDLARSPQVPRPLRVALTMTFGHAMVRPGDVDAAAAACLDTARHLQNQGATLNHWGSIGAALREGVVEPKQIGWALGCTSVRHSWGDYRGKPLPFDVIAHVDDQGVRRNG